MGPTDMSGRIGRMRRDDEMSMYAYVEFVPCTARDELLRASSDATLHRYHQQRVPADVPLRPARANPVRKGDRGPHRIPDADGPFWCRIRPRPNVTIHVLMARDGCPGYGDTPFV